MSGDKWRWCARIFAAWERGDYRCVEWAHPEIGFVIGDGPTPGSWAGVAAMAAAWREGLSAFEGLRVGPTSTARSTRSGCWR